MASGTPWLKNAHQYSQGSRPPSSEDNSQGCKFPLLQYSCREHLKA